MKACRIALALLTVLLLGTFIPAARAQNLPIGANTTNPSAPFYIDLTDLDFTTNPPTRNPDNPNYQRATELADGQLPPVDANGNFIIGPTHPAAPETVAQKGVPTGKTYNFVVRSTESKIYHTGLVRVESTFDLINQVGLTAPGDFSTMLVPNCFTPGAPYCGEAGTWSRKVAVYVPAQVRGQRRVPFLVVGDGGLFDQTFFTTLDNLIYHRRLPPMVAITIENGGQDAQGSQRGFEYDAVNGLYAEFVETEVLPLAEKVAGIRLTHDPDARVTMGISSSGAAAFTMAWFHPEWYHRVLAYSPTFVNQQWPHNPNLPGGAWEYHTKYAGPIGDLLETEGFNPGKPSTQPPGSPLLPTTPKQPIRMWYEVGDHDLWYPNPMADGMHDWVIANENMAGVLTAKGYDYQFLFARNAGHVDFPTLLQSFPRALEYLLHDCVPRDAQD